ncbi:hypothetical protein ACFYYS_00210 [Streptomyces sp. NPDC002120]|uniref:hypothetical protein n=1 Tax=Streptomyces sp. NPDC002120 TaxID=3364631 RepID=UPI0036762EF2
MQAVEIITALFGAGGLASVGLVFKATQARKDGFNKARAQHIEDLAAWKSELQNTVRELEGLVAFYRSQAADYEYQLRANGLTPETSAVRPAPK